MTIVNAFKKFFLKLNGSTPTGNTIAEVIRNGSDEVQLNNESAQAATVAALTTRVDTLEEAMPEDPVEYYGDEGDAIIIKNITVGETETLIKQFSIKVSAEGALSTELVGTVTIPNTAD